ncbi:MAG TPA: hypothetical protein VIG51_11915 [Candidatus Baltobacteraceae bacterium]
MTSIAVAATMPGAGVREVALRMNGASGGVWHVRLTRVALPGAQTPPDYQDTLTVTAPDGARAYRSPGDTGELLARLRKGSGTETYFPHQTASIAGTASLMHSDAQQVVLSVDQTGADCGLATITVLGMSQRTHRVVPLARATNFCDLSATVVGNAVQLAGPYYAHGAPLCCPTKPRVTATLRYVNNAWRETPAYFPLTGLREGG